MVRLEGPISKLSYDEIFKLCYGFDTQQPRKAGEVVGKKITTSRELDECFLRRLVADLSFDELRRICDPLLQPRKAGDPLKSANKPKKEAKKPSKKTKAKKSEKKTKAYSW
jgi:hypothetical protein